MERTKPLDGAQAPPPGRLGELDSLRGIAAALVMVYHCSLHLHEGGFGFPIVDLGFIAVAGFFVISGFVILMTAERHALPGFVGNRLIRIFPTYWLCLALTLVLVPLLGGANSFSLREIGANATMLQSFFFVRNIDDVYWSLQVELSFYVVIAALLAGGWLTRTEWLAVIGLGLFFTVNLGAGGWDPNWPNFKKVALIPFIFTGFSAHAPLLLGGMLFYRAWQSGFTWVRTALLLLCAGATFLSYRPFDAVGIALIFALFFRLSISSIAVLNHRALRYLGSISYPLYLVHNRLGHAILNDLVAVLPVFWAALAATILILLLASAIHFGFERPITRWLKASFSHRGPPGPDAKLSVGTLGETFGSDLHF